MEFRVNIGHRHGHARGHERFGQEGRAGEALVSSIGQIARFSTVGVFNTVIDFAVTNLLVFLFSAEKGLALALISIVACVAGMVNSFFWNKHWTFSHHEALERNSVVRFFGIATLSMLVNTSVFLFVYHYLSEGTPLTKFSVINVSKLAGVVVGIAVSFVGYKLAVFGREGLETFRDHFIFDRKSASGSWVTQCFILLAASAVVRALYLLITTAVIGDGVSYAKVAQGIASGQLQGVDAFWSNPFCFWEALFPLLGLGRISSAIAASLVPGILLPVPIAMMARQLYGNKVAWLAGALAIVHPRLVEYSCNGYAETFYLLWLALAVLSLMLVVKRQKVFLGALACGAAFGVYVGVRNEGLLPMAACLAGVAFIEWRQGADLQRLARLLVGILVGFSVMIAAYVALSEHTFGTLGVLQKLNLRGKVHLEQLEWHAAAKEAYGAHGSEQVSTDSAFVHRVVGNAKYVVQRLPGVLLTPIFFFVLLLPLLSKGRREERSLVWPLLVLLFFPLLLYPLLQVEPRYLFPLLIPIQIFGAAGLVAFSAYISEKYPRLPIYPVLASAILLLSLGLTLVSGWYVERGYRINRTLAAWIDTHVPKGELLVGCGYGYISNTAFLAGYPSLPRLWSSDPKEVVADMKRKGARWLIIYEAFLKKSNPELLPVLSQGMPGMVLRDQATDWNGDKVQVYELM